MQGQQTTCKLDAFVARIIQIPPSDDAQARLQIQYLILLVMVNRKAEISVRNHQIASFKTVFVSLLERSLDGLTAIGSLQHFFDEQTSGTIRTQRFENSAVADPDEDSVLVDSQPSPPATLIEGTQNTRFSRLNTRRMTPPIIKLLAIGGHEDRTLWNHAILNGDQAHRNISTFYGWSV